MTEENHMATNSYENDGGTMKPDSPPAPQRLYDLREWLMSQIDGSEETRGDDGLISDFIRQIDAQDAELADLKQRLLPQFQGRTQRAEHERDALLEQLIEARSSMQQAYGCLWRYVGASNPMFLQARKVLLARLTKEQQAIGIRYANELFGPTTEHEILHSDCSHDAAPSATAATDRPDWAQQLPGAEIFDRAARYEYIRTLNPRKFAALYNEALMGVHQFDDLVDRYRAKGKTVECGYDRSASLNAGKYVCTCGGACSHYDAGQSHSHHTTGEKP